MKYACHPFAAAYSQRQFYATGTVSGEDGIRIADREFRQAKESEYYSVFQKGGMEEA